MSFPNIPDVSPAIDINRDEIINLLLASIAFEELGLAHIINSEGEKIQFVLGTLEGQTPPVPPTIAELLEINRSVEQTLRSVIKNQMLLQFKLEDVLEIPGESTTTTSTSTTTTTTQTTTTTTTTESTTTTTTESTTTTTESTTTTTESTTTTTESTTTTTTESTTTTSTESTTTTTTPARVCDCGIQDGSSGSGTVPNQLGVDTRFIGGTANIQDPSICDGCGTGADDNLAYQVNNGGTTLRATAQLDTIEIQCPDPFIADPTPANPNTIIISGTADVTFTDPPASPITGTAAFIYTFNDGGTGPNADSFSIDLVSTTDELNHYSGVVSLNGNITIIDCPITVGSINSAGYCSACQKRNRL